MRAHRVRALLMGGQACVFYGAAEFSRDMDLAILAEAVVRVREEELEPAALADVFARSKGLLTLRPAPAGPDRRRGGSLAVGS